MSSSGARFSVSMSILLILLGAGASCSPKIARIGPNQWDQLASRIYPTPSYRAFAATCKYLGTVGIVMRAVPEAGVVSARVGAPLSSVATAQDDLAGMPEYRCTVSAAGSDSSRVTLRILNPPESKSSSSPVLETDRLLYTATLDSIASFLVHRRPGKTARR